MSSIYFPCPAVTLHIHIHSDVRARVSTYDEDCTSHESKSIVYDSCPEKGRFLRVSFVWSQVHRSKYLLKINASVYKHMLC